MKKNNKLNSAFTRTPKFVVTPKGGGFTLVETLVAISIFTMSILGLTSILASNISDTTYVKQKIAAEYLAQEGIEYVRNMRDTAVLYDPTSGQNGWDAFKSGPLPAYDVVGFPDFTRTISMTPVSDDEVIIESTVTWDQGSGSKSITLSENLFNWIE